MTTPQQPIPTPEPLDLKNIQGDILSGLPKKTETYLFFQITDVGKFRKRLAHLVPIVKSVAQVLEDRKAIEDHKKAPSDKPRLISMVGVNISFSHFGFQQMGINDDKLNDSAFKSGQLVDAGINLGDKGTGSGDKFVPDWEPAFKEKIHAMILVAGDSHETVNKKLGEIEQIFGLRTPNPTIREVIRIRGDVRPGKSSGHEHFGFLDGISNPAIIGFDNKPNPGPSPVRPGIIVTGRDGDASRATRDPWMVDGSFLVFRYLFQRVPEFDNFLAKNAIQVPGLPDGHGAELLGARLVGRWKSGAPIDLSPFQDDKELARDPKRNNNFRFSAERNIQKLCPFAAHIRKTLPRADLEDRGFSIESRRIMRRGVQFGPEVTKEEKSSGHTKQGRGLLFACYQSSITNGFQFIQTSWANNASFPPTEQTSQVPGFDALIGQGLNRKLSGVNPDDPGVELALPEQWVVPRGGEYFFAPSLRALKETLALAG